MNSPLETAALLDLVKSAINEHITCYGDEREKTAAAIVGELQSKFRLIPLVDEQPELCWDCERPALPRNIWCAEHKRVR